jgi:hypothetical protein
MKDLQDAMGGKARYMSLFWDIVMTIITYSWRGVWKEYLSISIQS